MYNLTIFKVEYIVYLCDNNVNEFEIKTQIQSMG